MRRIKDPRAERIFRIAIVGDPKTGHTRLAASAPRGLPTLFGPKAIYIAADPGSTSLDPVLKDDVDNLIVIDPHPEPKEGAKLQPAIGFGYDPLKEITSIVTSREWVDTPGVGTIIWDTFTRSAQDLLTATALTMAAPGDASERVTYGTPGKPDFHVSPSRSDYGSAQSIVTKILIQLFQQPLHLIVLFHERGPEGTQKGGPMTVGKAGVTDVGAMFSSVIRLTPKRKKLESGKRVTEYWALCNPSDLYVCGVRKPDTAPMNDVKLDPDPVNFWHAFAEAQGLKETSSERRV